MKSSYKVDSKEFGLAAGLVFMKYFLKTDHLHYGYWPDDLPVDITNLRHAQDRYGEILLSHIPGLTRSILDVGCGTGVLSKRLEKPEQSTRKQRSKKHQKPRKQPRQTIYPKNSHTAEQTRKNAAARI